MYLLLVSVSKCHIHILSTSSLLHHSASDFPVPGVWFQTCSFTVETPRMKPPRLRTVAKASKLAATPSIQSEPGEASTHGKVNVASERVVSKRSLMVQEGSCKYGFQIEVEWFRIMVV